MPRRNSNVNRSRYQVIEPVDTTRVESTPDLPPLPRETRARRRALKIRGW
ncbi:hypothetical protein ACIHCM_01450 [Streptomyces sp. NPDC052023]